jgi:hypothetical protein
MDDLDLKSGGIQMLGHRHMGKGKGVISAVKILSTAILEIWSHDRNGRARRGHSMHFGQERGNLFLG